MNPTNNSPNEVNHPVNNLDTKAQSESDRKKSNRSNDNDNDSSRKGRGRRNITSSSLLASSYVPQNLRAINALDVSLVIPVRDPPNMEDDFERVFCDLLGGRYNCHCNSNCNCNCNCNYSETTHPGGNTTNASSTYDHPAAAAKMEQHNKINQDNAESHRSKHFYCHCPNGIGRCTDLPRKLNSSMEAGFAADQAKKRTRAATVTVAPVSVSSTDDHDSTTASKTKVAGKSDTNTNTNLIETTAPSINNTILGVETSGTHIAKYYLPIFRELLQAEHAERERLYDQAYNQYNLKVHLPKQRKGVSNHQGIAELRIRGIADGHPSIRPGDRVLIRPKTPIPYAHLDPTLIIAKTSTTPPFANYSYSYSYTSSNAYSNAHSNSTNSYNNPYNNDNNNNNYYHYPPPFPSDAGYAHNGQQYPGQHIQALYYNPPSPYHSTMMDISAHVLSVKRGLSTGKQQTDSVLISWVTDLKLDSILRKEFCTVRFIPSAEPHERSLTALDWLLKLDPVVARDLLFPTESPKLPPPPAIDEANCADSMEEREFELLNKNQARFVQMVTTRTVYPAKKRMRPPMILTGPAGTGKTKTLLTAILQILRLDPSKTPNSETTFGTLPKPKILVCTPSHTACDVITQRLVALLLEEQVGQETTRKRKKSTREMIFRLYDATRPVETVPVQILPYARQRGFGGQFGLPDPQELLDFSVIICTCQDAHLLFMAGLTNQSLRRRKNCLIVDTKRRLEQVGLTVEGQIEGANKPHFTHLFIDEAAQATEPETLIPLSVVVDDHPEATKVEIALCGDPRQLGPSVYAPNAIEGLGQSLLERLLRLPIDAYGGGRKHLLGPPTIDARLTLDEMIEYSFQNVDYHQHLSVFLNLTYRGHPSFLYMPSKLFYFDKLRSVSKNITNGIWVQAIRDIQQLPSAKRPDTESLSLSKPMDWPILFHGVTGKCTSVAVDGYFGSNRWCNHFEAKVVVQIIRTVLKTGITTASIGVMAAFRAQVVLLRKILRKENLGTVNVGMVEDYQSMERDVIVLSLTRSNNELMNADVISGEGLFHQPKRMNVALTRAEHALVVVGNPNIMKEDYAWAQWLEFCKQNGLWYGATGEEDNSVTDEEKSQQSLGQ